MSRILFFLLALCITVSAQNKTKIYIDGGRGCNLSPNGNYDELASAIQENSTSPETGTFWLVLAKDQKGKIVAQTLNIKGKTNKLETASIKVAEKHKFSSDFDLLMLRVNSEGKKAVKVKTNKAKLRRK